jgi:hypothetical protein
MYTVKYRPLDLLVRSRSKIFESDNLFLNLDFTIPIRTHSAWLWITDENT